MTQEQDTQTPEQIQQESDAAMNAGFLAARGSEPSPQPEAKVVSAPVETKPESSAAPATEPAQEIDEWAGVPPKVKAELERISSSLEPVKNISDRLRNYEGSLGGLKTQLSQLSNDLKAAVAAKATTATQARGAEAPTQEQVRVALKDPERMKQLKEDYPDWADVFEGEIGAVHARIEAVEKRIAPPVDASALKTELAGDFDKRIAAALQPAVKDAEARARTYAYLDLKHGTGWEQRIASPEFEAWYAKQPKDVQALSASAVADDASKILALYDAHLKKSAEKAERDKRLERAAQPEGVPVAATTAEDPDEAMNAGFKAVRG